MKIQLSKACGGQPGPALMERVADTLQDIVHYNDCNHIDAGGLNDCCYCEAKRLLAEIGARGQVAA